METVDPMPLILLQVLKTINSATLLSRNVMRLEGQREGRRFVILAHGAMGNINP